MPKNTKRNQAHTSTALGKQKHFSNIFYEMAFYGGRRRKEEGKSLMSSFIVRAFSNGCMRFRVRDRKEGNADK